MIVVAVREKKVGTKAMTTSFFAHQLLQGPENDRQIERLRRCLRSDGQL
jgi:hypothetical protein